MSAVHAPLHGRPAAAARLTVDAPAPVRQTGPICCSYIAEDGLSIGWPVYLDRTGVTAPADLDLTPAEAERFERAKAQARASITEVMAYWDQHP